MIAGVITTPAAVIIPTHNRGNLLKKVLDAVLAQTVAAEVYVMDDASTDETEAIVQREYPQVVYKREKVSKGPAFQRNKGAALTRAEVLFTIDDDCVLASPNIFAQALEGFDHPRVGAVTLPFINVLKDQTLHTRAEKTKQVMATLIYYGGMIAFRREAFNAAGGYRSFFFMHVEESDLAIRLLANGYVVRLGWSDPIEHLESPVRNLSRLHVLGPRNQVLYSFYNVPWPYIAVHLPATTYHCLRHGWAEGTLPLVMRGLYRGYAGILHEISQRRPVSCRIYRLSRLLTSRSMPLEQIESMLPAVNCLHARAESADDPHPR